MSNEIKRLDRKMSKLTAPGLFGLRSKQMVQLGLRVVAELQIGRLDETGVSDRQRCEDERVDMGGWMVTNLRM